MIIVGHTSLLSGFPHDMEMESRHLHVCTSTALITHTYTPHACAHIHTHVFKWHAKYRKNTDIEALYRPVPFDHYW